MLPVNKLLVKLSVLSYIRVYMSLKRALAKDTPELVSKEVKIEGWVRLKRSHGKLIFLDIRDRSGLIQAVVNPSVSDEAYRAALVLRPEDAVSLTGKVNKRPENAINKDIVSGTVELEVVLVEVLSKAETLPFDMGSDELNLELPTLLDFRSLTLRHPKIASIFTVQEAVAEAFREASKKLDCTEIFVPTISASATEGGAEVFRVNYYDYNAYLTQSPQLYKQIMIGVFERVSTISHAYRAEPSVTTRHLAESTQLDVEMGFIENFEELLDAIEFVGTYIVSQVSKKCEKILSTFGVEEPLIPSKVPRLTLKEAQEIIFKFSNGARDPRGELDLNSTDETIICEWAKKEKKSDFVTVTHYPTKKRAFYSLPDPKNPEVSLSYDLLFRGMEILSGSQRVNNYEQLLSIMKERKLNPESFSMYLQAFRYGIPPEGGFSFGLERITMKILELANVREASLFPRDMERVDEKLAKLK